jgi:hypothetical protein
MPAPKQNQNAVKGDEPATSFLYLRATPADKSRWVKAAQRRRLKLTEWVIEKLNLASGQ